MSGHDDSLRKALEENARLRSEQEEGLRNVAASEFSGHMRAAERIYWAYALVCVALGVSAINSFAHSYDVKTLLLNAVVMIVLYETTVLMKLWFATARLKLDVLKEMKLVRLDIARLAEATGVENLAKPTVKFEPTRGASPWERKLWIVACAVVAMAVSTWSSHAWRLGGGELSSRSEVALSADGSAEKRTQMVRQYSSYYRPSSFTLYTPRDYDVRLLDASGMELPVKTTPTDKQNRHEVILTDGAFVDGQMRYTQVYKIPRGAQQKDGVWTYQDGLRHAGKPRRYSISVTLPEGAEYLSSSPEAEVKEDDEGRTRVRFEGMTENDVQHTFKACYKLGERESS